MTKNFFVTLLLLTSLAFNLSPLMAQDSISGNRVLIGDLYYNLDTTAHTAAVTWDRYIDTLNYHGLQSAIIPASVTFGDTEYQVTAIDSFAFATCTDLTSVVIPEGVTTIGNSAFRGSGLVETVVIPNSVTDIEKWAFNECQNLTEVTFGTGLRRIGDESFFNCRSLTELLIPDNVEYIGRAAFENLHLAGRIALGSGLSFLGDRAFQGSYAVPAYEVSEANTHFCAVDGVLMNRAMDTLIQFPAARVGEYSIPESVKVIGGGSFYGSRISALTIPEGVITIGDAAFTASLSLTELVIPNSVTTIGGASFSACVYLTKLTLGRGLQQIGAMAMAICSSLTDLVCYAVTPPATDQLVFYRVNQETCRLLVPGESLEAYRTADTWKDFSIIEAIPVEAIEEINTNNANANSNAAKVMVNGRLLIVKDGKTYSVTGAEVH